MEDIFDELKQLIEEKKIRDKFTEAQGFCIICGHGELLDLEHHHIAGKANSSLIISLCRNCHGHFSVRQQRAWPDGWSDKQKPAIQCIAMLLRGMSDILREISDFLWRMEK